MSKVFKADSEQTVALAKAAKLGSRKAFRESRALGLTITYVENGVIYQEDSDGKKIVVKRLCKPMPIGVNIDDNHVVIGVGDKAKRNSKKKQIK